MIEVLEHDVLPLHGGIQPLAQPLLVKEVADLNAGLGVFIGIEGGDAGLGRAEGPAGQPLLLIAVLQHMIGHQQLRPLRDDQIGGGHALVGDALQLCDQFFDVQRHAVSDDIGYMGIERTGGEDMQCKSAVVVDDGMTGIGAALKADDNIGGLRQHIGDFALALVAPVCAYDCFYHNVLLLCTEKVDGRPVQNLL